VAGLPAEGDPAELAEDASAGLVEGASVELVDGGSGPTAGGGGASMGMRASPERRRSKTTAPAVRAEARKVRVKRTI
jgi:hypothetical protein